MRGLAIGPIIRHGVFVLGLVLLGSAPPCFAQNASDGAFAAGRWHAEFATTAALEAWNVNISREQLFGLTEGVTYGLRNGLALTATQRIFYVSQQANDAWVLSLTAGLRRRVYERRRLSVFLEFAAGISDTSIATPPRGTRFNYLLMGSAGTLTKLRPKLHLASSMQVTHLSNASLKGPSRNPDIEAIGLSLGLLVGF
jgi:Lipid A 3-O-deacylase (PagL)